MIGMLEGEIGYRADDHLLIVAGGVGYEVYCSERTLASLPAAGGRAALYTDMMVRENLVQLFGFGTRREREFHRLLMTVQGVGANSALSIVGALGVEGGIRAVTLGDWTALKAAHGVGPRIAQRIVNELQGKTAQIMAIGDAGAAPGEDAAGQERGEPEDALAEVDVRASTDALSALANLGYTQAEAARAVAEAAGEEPELDAAALIKRALKRLAPQ